MTMDEIKAIFFDFGGVIARLDREQTRALEERYGLPRGGLLEALYGIPEWREAETGRLPEEEWIKAVLSALEKMAGRPIPQIQQEWQVVWRQLDEDVLALVQLLRERYLVGIISNSTPRLERDILTANGIDGLFHLVINSSRVGIAKPDPRIFLTACQRVGLPPQACVHIDDLIQNVQGAREAGFHAILHRGDLTTTVLALKGLGIQV